MDGGRDHHAAHRRRAPERRPRRLRRSVPAPARSSPARAGLSERHVRELLGGLVVGRDLHVRPRRAHLHVAALPCRVPHRRRRVELRSDTAALAFSAGYVDRSSIRSGTAAGSRTRSTDPTSPTSWTRSMRRVYDALLIDGYVPAVPGLHERLDTGARVADIGCGTGHTTNLLAAAYPRQRSSATTSRPTPSTRHARRQANASLSNANFDVLDVTATPDRAGLRRRLRVRCDPRPA